VAFFLHNILIIALFDCYCFVFSIHDYIIIIVKDNVTHTKVNTYQSNVLTLTYHFYHIFIVTTAPPLTLMEQQTQPTSIELHCGTKYIFIYIKKKSLLQTSV